MKALILAAGLGTRLLPFTNHTPKPLFPISGKPLLDKTIRDLIKAGCTEIAINTHHLHWQIDEFLRKENYEIPVTTRYEPEILGTGGAIKNISDFWDEKPFMVINSDILTDIDLKDVYEYHLGHAHSATLVLHDFQKFNNVYVNSEDFIIGFDQTDAVPRSKATAKLAFTGIQVIDSDLLALIPDNRFYSVIDLYRNLISANRKVKARIVTDHFWRDIGTPEDYHDAVYEKAAPEAFKKAFPGSTPEPITITKLKGDGSDRKWHRLHSGEQTLILVDHGIRDHTGIGEADSFIKIGRHLKEKGIPVPEIHLHHAFSGMVFLEDLGDVNLQDLMNKTHGRNERIDIYRRIIKLLIHMSQNGKQDFNPAMTFQTPVYDKELILDKECRYFQNEFLNGYLQKEISFKVLAEDFFHLADMALAHAITGFMHRDFQSRNIMVKEDCFYFIDFQGGRIGPLQYDLASLLIDPYVELPFEDQMELADFCCEKLGKKITLDNKKFLKGYYYCALTRNLQILGAFGFLSRAKRKKWFEQYIPGATRSLKTYLKKLESHELPVIKSIAQTIST
jgi:NDP-sugar pyrophosphorylase family protein/tRNA A-37 threonylcarbamoyl transferase component Bud32